MSDAEQKGYMTFLGVVAIGIMLLSFLVFGISWIIPVVTSVVAIVYFFLTERIAKTNMKSTMISACLIFAIIPNIVLMITDKTKAVATTFNIILLLVAVVIVFTMFMLPSETERNRYLNRYFNLDDLGMSVAGGIICFMLMFVISALVSTILMSTLNFSDFGMNLLTRLDVSGESVMSGFLLSSLLVINCNAISEDLLRAVIDINTRREMDTIGMTGLFSSVMIGFIVSWVWSNLHFGVNTLTVGTLVILFLNGLILVGFQRKFGLLSCWIGHSLYNILILAMEYGIFSMGGL